ncbi:hypothetical protein GWI33_010199 [Rhynchophorus ferrugineus]|uniref:Uncharacterized protein n=1 Tax=Rhynchophorus ferrugineus TaxID=354439 RepID=A0A834MNI6_RHYFE|nr:hypothetical protein GWI33_010199 [Rhynchophorus ferrugineus]
MTYFPRADFSGLVDLYQFPVGRVNSRFPTKKSESHFLGIRRARCQLDSLKGGGAASGGPAPTPTAHTRIYYSAMTQRISSAALLFYQPFSTSKEAQKIGCINIETATH